MNPRQGRRERAIERLRAVSGGQLSGHAATRAAELGYSLDDVLRCLARPEQTYPCPESYGPGRRMYQRGDLALVVHHESSLVITVLPRTHRAWAHGTDDRRTLFVHASHAPRQSTPH